MDEQLINVCCRLKELERLLEECPNWWGRRDDLMEAALDEALEYWIEYRTIIRRISGWE